MNGPEHYLEAERLVDLLDELTGEVAQEEQGSPDIGTGVAMIAATMQAAQVHATLALVAAQIECAASCGPGDVGSYWSAVLA